MIALGIATVAVFAPFAPWAALAIWLGLYARRVHEPLTRKLGGRTGLSAAITVSLLLVVIFPVALVITSIALDAVALIRRLIETEEAQAVLVKLVSANGQAPQDAAKNAAGEITTSGAVDLVLSQGDRAWMILKLLAGAAAHFVIGLLIMVTGMYGVLVDGRAWYAWAEDHAPISRGQFRRFGDAFVETGRGLWWGIVGAGALQAVIATIAYVVIGVPSALALGFLTLIFSVIPAIGTALVWVPVAAGLALTGRPVAAIALAAVGVALIGTVDNLARPWLASRGKLKLPMWVVLIAMFGGVELIGAWGLLMGPLAVRLAKEALVIAREAPNQAENAVDPATSGEPVETTTTS